MPSLTLNSSHPDLQQGGLIDEIVAGRFRDPVSGRLLEVPYRSIVIAPDLRGQERELVDALGLPHRLAVVSDEATHPALGERVEAALASGYQVESVVLGRPHADEAWVARLAERVGSAGALIAVGSGTVNDLCKYVTAQSGRPYAVFGTAASMNGYTSTTSSITLHSGLKTSLPAQAARGVFIDLSVSAAAPAFLGASGFGDSLCRSTAQVDSWLAHRLLGAAYTPTPFALQGKDEAEMLGRAEGVRERDPAALARCTGCWPCAGWASPSPAPPTTARWASTRSATTSTASRERGTPAPCTASRWEWRPSP